MRGLDLAGQAWSSLRGNDDGRLRRALVCNFLFSFFSLRSFLSHGNKDSLLIFVLLGLILLYPSRTHEKYTLLIEYLLNYEIRCIGSQIHFNLCPASFSMNLLNSKELEILI
jgi:hypothetical protein